MGEGIPETHRRFERDAMIRFLWNQRMIQSFRPNPSEFDRGYGGLREHAPTGIKLSHLAGFQ